MKKSMRIPKYYQGNSLKISKYRGIFEEKLTFAPEPVNDGREFSGPMAHALMQNYSYPRGVARRREQTFRPHPGDSVFFIYPNNGQSNIAH